MPKESDVRDELARILDQIAREGPEGMSHPRSLDAALDAIGSALHARAIEVRDRKDGPSPVSPESHHECVAMELLLEGFVLEGALR